MPLAGALVELCQRGGASARLAGGLLLLAAVDERLLLGHHSAHSALAEGWRHVAGWRPHAGQGGVAHQGGGVGGGGGGGVVQLVAGHGAQCSLLLQSGGEQVLSVLGGLRGGH